MRPPDFILIGGHKCATSSIHHYLNEHPDVGLISVKGRDLLAHNFDISKRFTLERYLHLFDDVLGKKMIGEVSSIYLYSTNAFNNIVRHLPQVKIMASLRNPIDRAYSHYCMGDYAEKGQRFDDVIRQMNGIIQYGFYSRFLLPYLRAFSNRRMMIFLFEDFKKDPIKIMRQLFRFLGIDETVTINTSFVMRKGGNIEKTWLYRLIFSDYPLQRVAKGILKPFITSRKRFELYQSVTNRFTKKYPPMSQESRMMLRDIYKDEILVLQEMLKIDLSHWK